MFSKKIKTAVLTLVGAFLFSSCIGSFKLFNNVLEWNQELTNNKFVNEVIFVILSPVYGICGMVDALVLNSIEFWTGDNPLAENVGKTQQIMGSDGLMYAVTNLKNGYEVKNADGQVVDFTFDKKEKTWSMTTPEGKTVKLLRVKDNTTAEVYLPEGRTIDVTLNSQGVFDVRMAMGGGLFYASAN